MANHGLVSGSVPDQDQVAVRPVMAAVVPGQCQQLQALEDAIKWRRARADVPCGACQKAQDGKCDDHGRDVDLIVEYELTARQLLQTALRPLSSDPRVTAARDLLAEQHQPAALATAELRSLLAKHQRRLRGLLDAFAPGTVATAEPAGEHHARDAVSGPFDTEWQARDLPAVRGIYDTAHASARQGVMAELCCQLLGEACADARVELGAFDQHVLRAIAGFEPEAAAVVAGIIRRAAADPHSKAQAGS